jgi:prephenate dehydrogenase
VSHGSSWKTVTIAGVGLIGGSFALALRKAGYGGKIIGVSSPPAIEAALARGVIDLALPLEQAATQSDVIYLAQPIERIIETLETIDPYVRPGTLITDAGSTKTQIVEQAQESVRRGRFVGGHPMAGKELRGVAAAEAGLFQGRPYILTARDPELEHWVAAIGSKIVILDAREHDRLVAFTSHLPQLISTALAASIPIQLGAERVVGPAALDLTRLALSPYEIWKDIFATNSTAIDAALETFIERLENLRSRLKDPVIESEFDLAAAAALRLRQGN